MEQSQIGVIHGSRAKDGIVITLVIKVIAITKNKLLFIE